MSKCFNSIYCHKSSGNLIFPSSCFLALWSAHLFAAEQYWTGISFFDVIFGIYLLPWLLKASCFYSSVIITAAYIVVYQCSHSLIQRLNSLPNSRFGYTHFLIVNWNSSSGCRNLKRVALKDCKFISAIAYYDTIDDSTWHIS